MKFIMSNLPTFKCQKSQIKWDFSIIIMTNRILYSCSIIIHWLLSNLLGKNLKRCSSEPCILPYISLQLTVMILSFRTDMPGQTVQTQIRLLLVCHSICIVWTHYSMVEPHCSNFWVITTIVLGVRIFRTFTAFNKFSNEWSRKIF